MMKVIAILCLFMFANAEDQYGSIDADINLSEVLSNDRLLASYGKCLVNKGPCTPEVKKLKDKIPEVLETQCAKCTDKQKNMGKTLVKEIKAKHPNIWSDLVSFYDPQGKYQKSFEEFLKD
ncbi:allergen Tha p 1-like [Colias croceus]|uniref:allergen Tha p 1-like n=1 Tax=Colias crocea TaxID=72248 RepID=UPI001E27D9DB|nr:allergen Tha p 1-like [Colias croceus]